MSKPKKNKTQDYTAIARQDAATAMKNWETNVQASRPNQVGPDGTNTWTKDANGNWLNTVAMTDDRQNLYDTANQKAQSAMNGLDTSQVDLSGAPKMPEVGGYNQQVIDTMRALQRPGLERARAAKEAQLAAMGVGTGTGNAWNTEQNNIGQNENDADLKSILAGINQGNTEFGQGMDAHKTGVNDIFNTKTANLQQAGGLMGLTNSFRMPSFAPVVTPGMPGAVNPNTVQGAMEMDKVKNANRQAQSAWQDKLLGAAGSIAGSFFGPTGAMLGGKLASSVGGMMGGGGPEQLGGTNY